MSCFQMLCPRLVYGIASLLASGTSVTGDNLLPVMLNGTFYGVQGLIQYDSTSQEMVSDLAVFSFVHNPLDKTLSAELFGSFDRITDTVTISPNVIFMGDTSAIPVSYPPLSRP